MIYMPDINHNEQNEHVIFPQVDPETLKQYRGYTRGALPHLSYEKGLFFVTTRLYDSVPRAVIDQKRFELQLFDQCIDKSTLEYQQKQRQLWNFIQEYEDAGYGNCFLKNREIAQMVLDALRFYDGRDYHLLAWSIMPNHIHFLIKLLEANLGQNDRQKGLGKCICKIKSYTSHQANKMLGRIGQAFWEREYFDRYIRNTQHLINVVKYIINNPIKINYTSEFTGTIYDDWKLYCGQY